MLHVGSPNRNITRRRLYHITARQHAATTLPVCFGTGVRLLSRGSAHQGKGKASGSGSFPPSFQYYSVTSLSCDLDIEFTPVCCDIHTALPLYRYLGVCFLRAPRCQCCTCAFDCRPATTTKTTWGCARANTPTPAFCAHLESRHIYRGTTGPRIYLYSPILRCFGYVCSLALSRAFARADNIMAQ